MKKALLLLLALSLFVPLQAQRVRNKPLDITLADIKSDEVIPMFGKPTQVDSNLIDGGMSIEYPHATFYYVQTWDPLHMERGSEYSWDGFETDSPDFCFLSDSFQGGIRVGDRIERIRKLDIVHSKAGKGREKNAIRKVDWGNTGTDVFEILGAEFDSFCLEVKDSVICRVHWETPIDWDRLDGGFLWKITGKELPAPSYILGVFPGAPESALRHVTGFDKAWDSAKAIYWQDPELGPWGRKIPDGMYLPNGKTLEGLFHWDEYVEIQDYVKQVTGFRPETLWWSPDGLTRHLLSYLLEQTMAEYRQGKDDMATSLYKKALAEGKEVHTLGSPYRFVGKDSAQTPKNDLENEQDLLRLVRLPEEKPEAVKEDIRYLYRTYLAEDQDEVGYFLYYSGKNSPIRTNVLGEQYYRWADELRQAMREGPILVIVDFTAVTTLRGLLYCFSFAQDHWFEPMKPRKKD